MTVLRVLEWPHASLSRPSRPVRDDEFGTEALYIAAMDLCETALAHGAAGLAAPQVGIELAIIALRASTGMLAICNPEVLVAEEQEVALEGCLSFRSVGWPLRAPTKVAVRYRDTDGKTFEGTADGPEARAFFHESEHTKGRTMLDRMGRSQRDLFLRAVAKARRR